MTWAVNDRKGNSSSAYFFSNSCLSHKIQHILQNLHQVVIVRAYYTLYFCQSIHFCYISPSRPPSVSISSLSQRSKWQYLEQVLLYFPPDPSSDFLFQPVSVLSSITPSSHPACCDTFKCGFLSLPEASSLCLHYTVACFFSSVAWLKISRSGCRTEMVLCSSNGEQHATEWFGFQTCQLFLRQQRDGSIIPANEPLADLKHG